jgi:putative ABC transport system permease protein
MEILLQDLRYSVRMLAKKPGFTAIAALTFAIGLGANAAIFSVVNTVLLRPLSYPDPDRVVALWETRSEEAGGRSRVTPANFIDWKQGSRVFQDMAAYGSAAANLTGAGEPEQILGARVSSGYFGVLGIQPSVGRSFLSQEYQPGSDRLVVLGHDLWARRFGSDPDIAGRPITLDGRSYTVIGVMPAGVYPTWPTAAGRVSFDPKNAQFWIPMSFDAEWAANRRTHVLGVVGRLRPGVPLEQASVELRTIARRLEQENPENKGAGIAIDRLMDEVTGPVRPALLTLLGAVGLVLIMACANIASLLLAQLAGRQREIGIRAALGATRGRLIRQFLVECGLLQVLGGAVGIILALTLVGAIPRFVVQQIPRLDAVRLDRAVLSLSLMVSLATAVPLGLMMAWQWSGRKLQEKLSEGGRAAGGGSGRQKLRRALVVAQVSLAVTLMIGAGLLIRSFWLLRRVDPGFNPNRVLTLNLTLPGSQYREWRQISDFYNRLLDRLQELPGVESAATAYDQPLQSSWIDSFTIESRPAPPPDQVPSADFHPVSPAYFSTVGIELTRGRTFGDQDDPSHPGAVIINRALARRYFPDEEPLGNRLRILTPSRFWPGQMPVSFEIVGIVGDVKSSGLTKQAEPAFYVPARQMPSPDMNVLVRTAGDPAGLIGAVRDAVWQIDPNQPIAGISTMDRIVSDSISQPRLAMVLMVLFGLMALSLATVGIYGLLSYTVRQRTHEIGVRMALGSRRADVLRIVVGDGLVLTMAGIGIGLAASMALTRLLSGLLFGVGATDPLTFVGVGVLLVLSATLASYLPARRASRMDPMVALRE